MYNKRHNVPKSWPVPRKGTAYLIRAKGSAAKAVPLLIVLRDMLKISPKRKEIKMALREKLVSVNSKSAHDERLGISLFDVISIPKENKFYCAIIGKHGKFDLREINEKEANEKIVKVLGKKILRGNKIQYNLYDGRNYISTISCSTQDSVIVDLSQKKIIKCIPLKEGGKALIILGKHQGKEGFIENIQRERNKINFVENGGKTLIEVPLQAVMMIR